MWALEARHQPSSNRRTSTVRQHRQTTGQEGLFRACCPHVNQSCKNWSSRNGDSTMRPTSTRSTRRRLVVASVVALSLAAAACGSDDDASSSDTTADSSAAAPADSTADTTAEAPADTTAGTTADTTGDSTASGGAEGGVSDGEARRAAGRGRRGCRGARVRTAGAGVRRVVTGRQEDLLDAGGEFADGLRQHGQVGRGHRPVRRDGGLVLLPERRRTAGLAGRYGAGDQRRLRRRRPRLRHRPQRADTADGSKPARWASPWSTCTSPTCRSRPIR